VSILARRFRSRAFVKLDSQTACPFVILAVVLFAALAKPSGKPSAEENRAQ